MLVLEPQELRRRLKERGIMLSQQLLNRYETLEAHKPVVEPIQPSRQA